MPACSRHHATLQLEGDRLWLEDLHSQNGTLVNTEAIQARGKPGDILTFGRTPLTITMKTRARWPDDPRGASPAKARAASWSGSPATSPRKKDGRWSSRRSSSRGPWRPLRAERGAIFLRESPGTTSSPAQRRLMTSSERFPPPRPHLARSLMRSRKARRIRSQVSSGRGLPWDSPFHGRPSHGDPLPRPGAREAGVPGHGRELLFALAWVTGNRMESARPCSRAGCPAAPATRWVVSLPRLHPEAQPGPAGIPGPPEPRKGGLLLELEEALVRVETDVLPARRTRTRRHARRSAPCASRGSRWRPCGASRSGTSSFTSPEVSMSRVIAELSGLDRERREYVLEAGAELRVLCDSADLVLALRLGAEVLEPATGGEDSSITVSATPWSDFGCLSPAHAKPIRRRWKGAAQFVRPRRSAQCFRTAESCCPVRGRSRKGSLATSWPSACTGASRWRRMAPGSSCAFPCPRRALARRLSSPREEHGSQNCLPRKGMAARGGRTRRSGDPPRGARAPTFSRGDLPFSSGRIVLSIRFLQINVKRESGHGGSRDYRVIRVHRERAPKSAEVEGACGRGRGASDWRAGPHEEGVPRVAPAQPAERRPVLSLQRKGGEENTARPGFLRA